MRHYFGVSDKETLLIDLIIRVKTVKWKVAVTYCYEFNTNLFYYILVYL